VTVLEAGAIPNPLAESTDVSKAVRMDYGADEFYVGEMERALDAWRAWNVTFGETLFRETGAMFVTGEPMAPGGFEHDSFVTLGRRGHRVERLDAGAIAARSSLRGFVDGYFNPQGGFVESAQLITRLSMQARDAGVKVIEHARVAELAMRSGRVTGAVLADGQAVDADAVVVTAGGWASDLVPDIAGSFRTVGQPVFHVEARGDLQLPVFGADIARTGWYGFPAKDGFVKIANHGVGRAMHPDSGEREIAAHDEERLRVFLRTSLPTLEGAPLLKKRVCVYCDTLDEHFWIAPHPAVPNLVVATGGSGHAFKFAPLLGDWIARALGGDVIPRFRWRPELEHPRGEEPARNHS
jgi:glycine/D-amino acid oxidase-like deaminating enzyme